MDYLYNNIKNNLRKNQFINAGLFVVASSTVLTGAYLKDKINVLDVVEPIKELIKEEKVTKKNVINNDSIRYFNSTINSNLRASDMVYLSDIPYIEDKTNVGWGSLTLDKNLDGGRISLIVNGKRKYFLKGITAHANANLEYDISNYDYDFFTARLGVDASRGTLGDGVRFEVSTSLDGETWTSERINDWAIFKGDSESYFLKVPISGVKKIKIEVNQFRNNASDHSVIADAKLIKSTYEEPALTADYIKTVEEYDAIIKNFPSTNLTKDQELVLFQRELVKNATYDTLQNVATLDSSYNETISWLMNNLDILNLYIMGGTPDGGYFNSLVELNRLYHEYSTDFTNTELLNNKWDSTLTYGDLYKKMAITLSLTHGQRVGLWMGSGIPENQSDSLRRYAIYKYIHKNGKFRLNDNYDYTAMFESLKVEEMRYIMNNAIDDEEILWLNAYVTTKVAETGSTGWITPHPHISYVWPNYGNPVYFAEENRDYFNELFAISDSLLSDKKVGLWDAVYNIPGGKNIPSYSISITRGTNENKITKVWMNFRNKFGTGCVCGGISKSGSNIRTTHGIPATVIGQPGHAALLAYNKDANGNGFWGIDNDVSGWTLSEKGERLPLGWGNANTSYARGSYQVVYVALAQEALNDYENYEKSQKLVMLADSATDKNKKEQLLRSALDVQSINLNAWLALIDLYNNDDTKKEKDYYELAQEVSEALKYFPLPMYHMTNLIKPKLTSIEYSYMFTLLQTRTLTEASTTPNNTADNYYVYQPSLTRTEANFLLGQIDKSIATFSFDGEDAGKIVLSSRFDGNGVRWDYSIETDENGNRIWKEKSFDANEEHKLQLTQEEISKITSENDLYVHIVGVNYDDENIFKIDIKESLGLPRTLYANDLENKLIASVPTMMWKYNENDEWTYFKDEEPDLTGDRDIIVKAGATGLYLASNESVTYHFTNNPNPENRKYIPISHLSIASVSSEATSQGRQAVNIIDGNINTSWHSAWNGSDTVKEIVIKLDEIKNITSLDYYPLGGGNGKIEKAKILVSMDGVNYIEAATTDWTYANTADVAPRTIDFDPVRGQYIKIIGVKTQAASAGTSFIAGAMLNFYENTTIKVLGSFSFDGENAGKIVLNDADYTGEWSYSLDNGNTWNNASGSSYQLNTNELNSITSENGIRIKFAATSDESTIKIKEAEELVLNPYLNDLENRLIAIGDTSKLEWRIKGSEEWTSYSESEPIVTGNNVLQVRVKANGTTLPSNILEYQFTDENLSDEESYISISHLSIHDYSSQSVDSKRPYYAQKAIDGNIYTQWHTDFRVAIADKETFITIKLDKARYISAVDYLHMQNELYGYLKSGKILVSEDGENWTEALVISDVEKDDELKHFKFDKPVYGQYVKFVMESHDNVFATAAMINLYEDLSQSAPTVDVEYSTSKKTNNSVTATIVSDKDITITNNNGSNSYTFDENGTFVFEYSDADGNVGTITATVSWIDKILPTGTITYSTKDVTNQDVTVTLVPSENITVTNNGGSLTYIFTENGEFTFEFVDEAGNVGTATANVTWINKSAPTGTISYSTTKSTNGNVVATINVPTGVTISNNGGSKEYTFTNNGEFTFEFIDQAGNRGTLTARVNWIDRVAPKGTVVFDIKTKTNKNVTATLLTNEKTTITNNNGSDKHVFTENGSFTFEFVDEAGNKGTYTITVDWIDKTAPTAKVKYNPSDITNQNVVATLVPSEKVTVINNNGSLTYTFTENGSFTFEFVDEAGNKGTCTAVVDWINKKAPTAEVTYSTTSVTNGSVVATIKVAEGVTITNNNGSNRYVFTDNGIFTFEFIDEAGNKGVFTTEVSWIDKIAPTGTVTFNTKDITNQDVVATLVPSEPVTVTNNNGSLTYRFTENGSFTFEFVDAAGNAGSLTVTVDWINKNAPTADLSYSTTKPTNGNVVATIIVPEGVIITNNNGSNTYTFTENGEFKFEFVNEAGNKGTATAKVNWIDKVAPTGTITFDVNSSTDKPVTATLSTSEVVTIINNNGSNKYVFTKNGTFTFEFVDAAGNKGTATANVDWIVDHVENKISFVFDKTTLTDEDVTATLISERPITIINNGGSNKHTFTENGDFYFEYIDEYGNAGVAKVTVNWIDKIPLSVEVNYNIKTITSSNVIATIKSNKNIVITNNNGSASYTFTENGEFTFEFVDHFGRNKTFTAKVDWIDKTAPTAKVRYSTLKPTNEDVTVRLQNPDGELIILNNGGSNKYTFTENGEFVFEYMDKAGNKGSTYVKVDWIDREAPTAEIEYSTKDKTNKDVVVTLKPSEKVTIINNNGSDTYIFTENGTFTFEFVDEAGNKGTYTVEVDWIYKKIPLLGVEYSTDKVTTSSVTANLIVRDGITITNNGGSNTYTFTKNGIFTFEYVDEYGNVGSTTAEVNWIREETIVQLEYSTVEETEGPVTVKVISNNKLNILNNNGSDTYVFTNNGVFTFHVQDEFGKVYYMAAAVNWIKKDIIVPDKPSIPVDKPIEGNKPSTPDQNINVVKPTRPASPNTKPTTTTTNPTTTTTTTTKKVETTTTKVNDEEKEKNEKQAKYDMIAIIVGIVAIVMGSVLFLIGKRKKDKKKKFNTWDNI